MAMAMGILCSTLGSCLSSLEPQQIFYASDEMMVMVMQALMVIVGVVARAADRSVTALLPVCLHSAHHQHKPLLSFLQIWEILSISMQVVPVCLRITSTNFYLCSGLKKTKKNKQTNKQTNKQINK